jgi:hypothetical protein
MVLTQAPLNAHTLETGTSDRASPGRFASSTLPDLSLVPGS